MGGTVKNVCRRQAVTVLEGGMEAVNWPGQVVSGPSRGCFSRGL